MQLPADNLRLWSDLVRSLRLPSPTQIPLAMPPTPFWRSVIDAAAALATVVVGIFAVVAVLQTRDERHERRREVIARVDATDARIESIAFALRRQIDSWMLHPALVNLNNVWGWTEWLIGPTNIAEHGSLISWSLRQLRPPPCGVRLNMASYVLQGFDLVNLIHEIARGNNQEDVARMLDAKIRWNSAGTGSRLLFRRTYLRPKSGSRRRWQWREDRLRTCDRPLQADPALDLLACALGRAELGVAHFAAFLVHGDVVEKTSCCSSLRLDLPDLGLAGARSV